MALWLTLAGSTGLTAQIWFENFDAYPNGTINAPPKWTSYANDCDDGGINTASSQWGVWDGVFTVNDIEGDCCPGPGGDNDNGWLSEVIDIAGFCDVSASMLVTFDGALECDDPANPIFTCNGSSDNSHDQVVVEYKLDNGPFQQMGYVCGGNGGGTIGVTGLNGNTLQLRFFAANKANTEYYFIDFIVVEGGAGTTPLFNPIGPVCENAAPIPLPGVSTNGITGSWDVGTTFVPAGQGGNLVTLIFTPDPGQCAAATTLDIQVLPTVSVQPAPIGPFCTTDPPVALPAGINGINGTWAGPGVTAGVFQPAGSGPGTFSLVFTPFGGQCAVPASLPVTVSATPSANATTLVACGANGIATFDLTAAAALVNNQPGTAVSWYEDPAGNTPVADPAAYIASNGTLVYAFVSQNGCTSGPAAILLTVNAATAPPVTGVPASVCQNAGPLPLPTIQGGINGQWSGPGVSNNSFQPAGLSGPVSLVFTPVASACALPATFLLTVTPPGPVTLSGVPGSWCQTAGVLPLPGNQSGTTGTWSGSGVLNNTFDPSGITGLVDLTFTPAGNACLLPTGWQLNVLEPETPALSGLPDTVCAGADPIALPTEQGAYTGTWSGPGVAANAFDPAGLSGPVSLTFTPGGSGCVYNAVFVMTVAPAVVPQLDSAQLCQTAPPLDLGTLVDPAFPAGAWSGPGVSGNLFDPAGLTGPTTLSFLATAGCAEPALTVVDVFPPVQPVLASAAVCVQEDSLPLSLLADPLFPVGTWTGPGVSGALFLPAGLSGPVTLTFLPAVSCPAEAVTTVTVHTAPFFTQLETTCDLATQSYTVSFQPSGGDSLTYTVDGLPLPGPLFVSGPLPSGQAYQFLLDDGNGCGPVAVAGSVNCDCATSAGTLDAEGSPLSLCMEAPFEVPHNGDEVIGATDLLRFILHDNPGTQPGNILAVSDSTWFEFPAGVNPGQTYYLSAMAGAMAGNGQVDLNDPCLSVSPGVPVSFHYVDLTLPASDTLCDGECLDLPVGLAGVAPFGLSLSVTDGQMVYEDTFPGVNSPFVLQSCLQVLGLGPGLLDLQVTGLVDADGCTATESGDLPSMELLLLPPAAGVVEQTLCAGDSLTVGGIVFDAQHPADTLLLPGIGVGGCDSSLVVNLQFLPEPVFLVMESRCAGDSLLAGGVWFHSGFPSGSVVLPAAAANGCDSTIEVVLTFQPVPTTVLSQTLCPDDSLLVNGVPYHAANPEGTEVIPAGSYLGCDSVVVVDLSFHLPAVLDFTQTLCTGGSVVLAGTTYDENNPTDTVILAGAGGYGCDSFIYIQLTFNEVVLATFADTLCPGASLTVGGVVYDINQPAGTEVFPGGSYLGCDSVVTVDLTFLPPAVSMLVDTLCAGSFLVVNGILYDAGHPSGTEILSGGSYLGCDSVVTVDLTFLPPAVDTLSPLLCAGTSVTIDGVLFDESQPVGTIAYPGGGYLGCDSALVVQLAFLPPAQGSWSDTLCPGGSYTLQGVTFDISQPSGTVVLPQAAWTGCDSVVQVSLTFSDAVTATFAPSLCPGEVVFINGTLYFAGNPTGSETFPGGSYLGCDSTVLVSLSYYPDAVGSVSVTLPPDGSVVVNGTLYNLFNPSGTEVLPGGSVNGCDSVVLVDLTFLQTLVPDIVLVPPACKGGADGEVRIESLLGGDPPYTISLTGYPSQTTADFPVAFEGLPTGFYFLLVKDAAGNSYAAELLLPDPPPLVLDAGPDQVLSLGTGTTLSPTAGFAVETWSWSPPDFLSCTDCENPSVLSPSGETTYTLSVLTAAGCTASDEVVIAVQPVRRVYVPNAFSPDGDGINEFLHVFAGPGIRAVPRFQVFDRWGGRMYEEADLDLGDTGSGWDGRHRGEDMPAGVYVWVAEVEFVDGVVLVLKGEVNLLR